MTATPVVEDQALPPSAERICDLEKPNPSRPLVENAHLFDDAGRTMLLVVASGAIYELEDGQADILAATMARRDSARVSEIFGMAGWDRASLPAQGIPAAVSPRAYSLAVAEKCNLGCTYCYAQQGSFGGPSRNMSIEVARATIDRLLQSVPRSEKASLSFLGGEPLANRAVLRSATEYAAAQAGQAGLRIEFAITTNGTLLNRDDAAFFSKYRFSVTISIDGIGEVHDALRPFKSGAGSYARVVQNAALLLDQPLPRCAVQARVTVTPRNLNLQSTLNELVSLGFDGVQFSPMLKSPSGKDQMEGRDFALLLQEMVACGDVFARGLSQDRWIPFTNVVSTLRKIHRYRREEYPCGAGGGYMGVSAEGSLHACHRFVDDDSAKLGSVVTGVDAAAQHRWLAARHLSRQEPCGGCWARYLCSGGCHHEAIYRGRPACDYIRGWLHYCLGLYSRLLKEQPPLLSRVLGGA